MSLQERFEEVRGRIGRAEARAGRPPGSARLLAITKTVAAPEIRVALGLGQTRFGENRVQEAEDKAAALGGGIEWHLVGHLQANKARRAALLFDCIHGIDSLDLALRLHRLAAEVGRRPRLLLQIDLAGEPTKFGLPAPQLPRVLDALGDAGLPLPAGLMLLQPQVTTPEAARPWFRRLAVLAGELAAAGRLPEEPELSMGMSGDFEVAVEEGATLVRVGTALFGDRAALSR